ncbi:sigma-70 family RNA polymerase sigma factor, partial [Myxococcota bacterium]|nr:sigma-70 family RNA polymerase sigma factor [Myxococcota bacterium]
MSLQTDPIQQADLELLRGCIRGERRAWSAFVERFSRYIYYVIRRTYERAGISDVAEEIADLHNEIFIALLEDDRRRLRQYRGDNGCTVRSWVRLIAARKTLDALRRRRTHIPLEDSATKAPTDPGEDPLQRLLTREGEAARAQLDGFIARLSATDQALLKRIYEDQASADEIAQALGIK